MVRSRFMAQMEQLNTELIVMGTRTLLTKYQGT